MTATRDRPRTVGAVGRYAWVPIPVLFALITALWVANLQGIYESRTAMVLLNLFFTWLASLSVSWLTGRGFVNSGQPGLLMFGCGSLVWGFTSLLAAAIVDQVNVTVTIHNVGVLAAAICHFGGVLWHGRIGRPARWLGLCYAGALTLSALIVWTAISGVTPLFFVQGHGGTAVREVVLIAAVILFAWVAWQMAATSRFDSRSMYYWYGLGLGLVATGLTGVVLLTVQGGVLGWTNRLTQYLGSAYLFVAAWMAAREAGGWTLSLAAVEGRLREVLGDNLPLGAFYRFQHDTEGCPRFLYVSRGIEALTGVSPAEILRDPNALHDTIHPEDRARLIIEEEKSRQALSPFEMEIRERHRSTGEERWSLLRSVPSQLQDGTTVWDGVQVDITDRKRVELELEVMTRLYAVLSRVNEAIVRTRDESALYSELCRIVADEGRFPLVWVGLVQGRAVVPTASWGRATDYLRGIAVETDGELGQGPGGTCIRENRPVINDDFDVNPGTRPWREASARHGLRASAAFPLHCGGSVVGNLTLYADKPGAFAPKQVKLLEALCADVSYALEAFARERQRAEAESALRVSEGRLGLAFDAARAAAWEVDLCAGKHFWEDRFFPLLCVPPERREWAEQHWTELVLPEDQDRASREFNASCADDGPPYDSEFRARRMDGIVRWFRSRGVQIRDAGDGRRMVGFVQDITDQKEAQERLRDANEKLREADRRKDEFLGMLSHELRNPLAPIRNSTYILRHAQPGGEQAQRAQEVIERQTSHLARLVDDLLDVTRIARGKIELRRARIDLRDVVWRAADDYRLLVNDRGVRFQVTLPDDSTWSDADPTRITQVIGNLLHNASKFTLKGGEVTLSLDRHGHDAVIRVRDTGAGIDPDLLPNIFEAFVQGKRTLARTEGGLGLGLALVKGIVDLHGGMVSAVSAGKGLGAEFTVRLPLSEAAPAQPDLSAGAQPSNGRRRVLVVDDNHDAAESLADIVKMLGHVVEVAFDGPGALEKARTNPPNVVLCDIGLPGMSGYEVGRALRALGVVGMQLLAVTGYAQPEDAKRATDAGFDGHVAKPVDIAQIERLLS